MGESREELEAMIEATLAERFPEVELVDLDLCAALSAALDEVREHHALEVSSPGLDRRLRKPAHFAAALGRDVAVKLSAPREGRSNFRGVLTASDATSVTLDLADGGGATLPLANIAKAHVVYNFDDDGGHP